MAAFQIMACCSVANVIVSVTSGNFKYIKQIPSSRAGHTFPGGVFQSVTTHTPLPLPSLCPYLLTHSYLLAGRETALAMWRDWLSNFMLSTLVLSHYLHSLPQQSNFREIHPMSWRGLYLVQLFLSLLLKGSIPPLHGLS